MKKLIVNLPDIINQEYPVFVGAQLLDKINSLTDLSSYSKVAIITDRNVIDHLEIIKNNLIAKPLVITLEPGEINKNINNLEMIWQELAKSNFDRKSLVINLGGGVICDIGGFAASTYMRGVDFINIPTTLLSQVDASVGGKTGIDFMGLKNLIGTFQQPKAVIIDIQNLKTLPEKEFISGFAEIIKHGIIADKKYFELVTSKPPLEFSSGELIDIIAGSCEIKKEVVERDVSEQGLRKILNFGHTIGHAIESLSLETDNPLLHGEAISIGMLAEAKISQLMGYLKETDVELIKKCLENAGLPTKTVLQETDEIIKKIESDKKNAHGKTNFVLLQDIGKAVYDRDVTDEILLKAINDIKR